MATRIQSDPVAEGPIQAGICVLPGRRTLFTCRIENPAWARPSGTGSYMILSPLIINPDTLYECTLVYFIPMPKAQGSSFAV